MKKRVHEIAKQHGLTSKEVLAALKAGGIEAKVAASSVEEGDALKALATAGDGAKAGAGDAPTTKATTKSAADSAPKEKAKGADPKTPAKKSGPQANDGDSKPAPKEESSARPKRRPPSGEQDTAKSSGRKRRRVVIDSQASRRDHMPAPPPPRPPRRRGGRRRRPLLEEPPEKAPVVEQEPEATKIASGATVREVAETLGLGSAEVIKSLMEMGEMATLTQTLPDETVAALAKARDQKVEIVSAAEEAPEERAFADSEEDLKPRPPVVTIMGHVDHGKTSLLDAIRETEVVAGEAGGITQHIGAYQVHHGDKEITFLDTPGHEAFTAMRARGAQVTDIAVIVVAADDGVMPQTREAVDHAKAAEVPMLVAVNKIDKEGAQPDRVRTEMTNLGLQPEEWGGDTMFVDVSAKTHQNLEELLESILLLAEVEELKANPDTEASGVVVESKLDPGRGAVVTVLVNRGTLHVGDALVAGAHWGRVRAMQDYKGTRVKEAGPSEPVEVLGFDSVPEAGETVRVVENDRRARQLANERAQRLKAETLARRGGRKVSLETIFEQQRDREVKELNLVLKADVSGSLEAFEDEIAKLPQQDVQVEVVRAG